MSSNGALGPTSVPHDPVHLTKHVQGKLFDISLLVSINRT